MVDSQNQLADSEMHNQLTADCCRASACDVSWDGIEKEASGALFVWLFCLVQGGSGAELHSIVK